MQAFRRGFSRTCDFRHAEHRLGGARACRRKFLSIFPGGFKDPTYLAWERDYKWEAHRRWDEELNGPEIDALLSRGRYAEIAARALRIESRTNLLFSFEKALKDAVRSGAGAKLFAMGLREFLDGKRLASASKEPLGARFDQWCDTVSRLPRKQTRVLTWPVVTVFGFLAQPKRHFFVKPMVCKRAAENYGFPLDYHSQPNHDTYAQYLKFAGVVRRDLSDLKPRDMIDLQSFLWVQGSDEYE